MRGKRPAQQIPIIQSILLYTNLDCSGASFLIFGPFDFHRLGDERRKFCPPPKREYVYAELARNNITRGLEIESTCLREAL